MNAKTSLALAILLIPALACNALSGAEPTPTATLLPTDTPQPTDTSTPEPTPNRTATAEVVATATAEAVTQLIGPDMDLAGYSLNNGNLAWTQRSPIDLRVTNPNSIIWDDIDAPSFENFILGVDVTWDSETGLAGCDIVFRSEADVSQGDKIVFETLRLSGLPAWDLVRVRFNQLQGNLTGGVLTNAAIRQGSGDTNHYVLVADELSVTVYANGTRLGGTTLPAARNQGIIAFEAWQESGQTTCTFDNAWVWELPSGN